MTVITVPNQQKPALVRHKQFILVRGFGESAGARQSLRRLDCGGIGGMLSRLSFDLVDDAEGYFEQSALFV